MSTIGPQMPDWWGMILGLLKLAGKAVVIAALLGALVTWLVMR